MQVKTTNEGSVYVPTDDFQVRIARDQRLVDALADDARKSLLHDEAVRVFDNPQVLQAAIDGRTYTTDGTLQATAQPRTVFLLVTVAGPGSANPSARLQLSPVYRSLVVSIRRRGVISEYADIPIQHVHIIAGNEKTHVIQK